MQLEDSVRTGFGGPDWMRLRGEILEGGYQLEDVIAADAEFAAFRVRVLGDASLDAVAHFYFSESDAAEEQAAVWHTLRELRHPNLNTPLEAGRKDIGEGAAAYLVLRRTDERLSGALEDRALRPAEAGDLLRSLLGALNTLGARNLVHGCLSPEHVLATEQAILLSTECVRRAGIKPAIAAAKPKYLAPESESRNTTPEADIWCLGATLFEALTRKECGPGCREEGARLPLPFGRIVQRCLEADPRIRCKLPEVAELFSALNAPTQAGIAERPPARETAAPRPTVRIRPWRGWAYVAVAVLIAIAVVAFARKGHRPTPATQPVATAAVTRTASAPKPAWPTRTLSPDLAKQTPRHDRAREETQAASSTSTNRSVWRLILYTYDRQQDAEARAAKINQRYPGLKAESFSPGGSGSPYLVVAGGQMNREAAAQLRSKAVRMGLPHDAYIQNFRR